MPNILNTIYPPQCLLCGRRVMDNYAFCGGCIGKLTFSHGLSCDQCAQPLPGNSPQQERCDTCIETPPPWERARVVFLYQGVVRDLILDLKNQDRTDLAHPLGGWLAKSVATIASKPGALIVPVPIHWTRMMMRKYNHSALLAREVSRRTGHQFAPGALKRVRRTPKLANLDAETRETVMDGPIKVRRPKLIKGRDVVLIDDVLTTGSTLRACAQACRDAGAQSVKAVVLARTQIDA